MGARAIADLMAWYEARWAESIDFKNDLIDLLDASKFGGKEYTPYQVYINSSEASARGIHATSVAVEERRNSDFSPLS